MKKVYLIILITIPNVDLLYYNFPRNMMKLLSQWELLMQLLQNATVSQIVDNACFENLSLRFTCGNCENMDCLSPFIYGNKII